LPGAGYPPKISLGVKAEVKAGEDSDMSSFWYDGYEVTGLSQINFGLIIYLSISFA